MITREVARVDVDLDAGICRSVEFIGSLASWCHCARTLHVDVDALGVVLRAIRLTSGVEGDDLMSKDILSRGNALGNGNAPGEVVSDELRRSPLSILVASLIDFEEVQTRSLGGSCIINLRKVVEDWTNVRLGPGVPLDIDSATSLDSSDLSTSSGVFVASDLGNIGVHRSIYKSIIEALGAGPFDDLWSRILILERWVVGGVRSTINSDQRKMTVSLD